MDLETFKLSISRMTPEELSEQCVRLYEENNQLRLKLEENEAFMTDVSSEFKKTKDKLIKSDAEVKRLGDLLAHAQDRNILDAREMFGRHSEKSSGLKRQENEDPLSEDSGLDEDSVVSIEPPPAPYERKKSDTDTQRKPRRTRDELTKNILVSKVFEANVEQYNNDYGEFGWSIIGWDSELEIHHVRAYDYGIRRYKPIISHRDKDGLPTITRTEYLSNAALWPKSYATPSLLADILYSKSVLHQPFERQAKDRERRGFPISKQVMCQWGMRAAEEFFVLVFEFLCDYVRADRYQQGDETALTIIKDGREAGATSYIWVHCTSEYSERHPAVVYIASLTRNTANLRTFYESESTSSFFYKTCDAYSSYQSYESEAGIRVRLTGCFMHVRRRWVKAFMVLLKSSPKADKAKNTEEYRAIELCNAIFAAESELRECSAEERKIRRMSTTAPAVDAYFDFIKTIDLDDPAVSEKKRDAICYSLNQEKYLRRFLEDGHLSCHNGESERLIKPIALGRRNWLFNNTLRGAKASCIVYSLTQTAIRNKADPYFYLQYLLERMPRIMEKADSKGRLPDTPETRLRLNAMMPWSKKYREYEQTAKDSMYQNLKELYPDTDVKPPKAPRKRDAVIAG